MNVLRNALMISLPLSNKEYVLLAVLILQQILIAVNVLKVPKHVLVYQNTIHYHVIAHIHLLLMKMV